LRLRQAEIFFGNSQTDDSKVAHPMLRSDEISQWALTTRRWVETNSDIEAMPIKNGRTVLDWDGMTNV
jgi:hypothetical protein